MRAKLRYCFKFASCTVICKRAVRQQNQCDPGVTHLSERNRRKAVKVQNLDKLQIRLQTAKLRDQTVYDSNSCLYPESSSLRDPHGISTGKTFTVSCW